MRMNTIFGNNNHVTYARYICISISFININNDYFMKTFVLLKDSISYSYEYRRTRTAVGIAGDET